MTTRQTTRRALLGAAAAVSAAALPAIAAVQSSDAADPIFAALDRWRKVETECDRLLNEESDGGINQSPAAEAAVRTVWQERMLLAETASTTLAGLAAYVSFLRRRSVDELEIFFFEDGDGEYNEQLAFIESLDRSLASITATHGEIQS
jgi:hypothetical protein